MLAWFLVILGAPKRLKYLNPKPVSLLLFSLPRTNISSAMMTPNIDFLMRPLTQHDSYDCRWQKPFSLSPWMLVVRWFSPRFLCSPIPLMLCRVSCMRLSRFNFMKLPFLFLFSSSLHIADCLRALAVWLASHSSSVFIVLSLLKRRFSIPESQSVLVTIYDSFIL
jgi:hypothetical protein